MLIKFSEFRECDLRTLPVHQWPPEANELVRVVLASSWARSKLANELFPLEWLVAQVEGQALRQQQVARDFIAAERGDL